MFQSIGEVNKNFGLIIAILTDLFVIVSINTNTT